MPSQDDSPSMRRRTVLKAAPALAASTVAMAPAAAVDAELSPLASRAGGWLWTPPREASIPTFDVGGASVPAFHVELADSESFDAVSDWVSSSDTRAEHDQYRHADSKHTVVAASPSDIGLAGLRQRDPLFDEADVEYVDVVQEVELIAPVSRLPAGSGDASLPRLQRLRASFRRVSEGIDDGLAYDEHIEQSTLRDARLAANTDAVDLAPDASGLVAAIVDTGVDDTTAMQDATGSSRLLSSSKRFVGGASTGRDAVADGQGHGTHVAETVAGNGSDSVHDGWAPAADVLGVKVLGDDGSGTSAAVAAGVRYAADQAADVMTLSLGGLYSGAIDRAVSYAAGAGTLPVAAAGNARLRGEYVSHPAANEDAVTVAAITVDDPAAARVASFSNPGPQPGTTDLSGGETAGREPDVAAPGTEIRTATEGYLSGTSMAAPHAAGAALWVQAATGESTPAELKRRLHEYAAPMPGGGVTDVGGGALDVHAAINEIEPSETQKEARDSNAETRDEANRARANGVLGGWLTGGW